MVQLSMVLLVLLEAVMLLVVVVVAVAEVPTVPVVFYLLFPQLMALLEAYTVVVVDPEGHLILPVLLVHGAIPT
jgi:hypothetical protein